MKWDAATRLLFAQKRVRQLSDEVLRLGESLAWWKAHADELQRQRDGYAQRLDDADITIHYLRDHIARLSAGVEE